MKHCPAWILVLTAALPAASAQLPPMSDVGGKDATRRPRLFVAQPVCDLGSVIEGDKVTARWRLENRGDADLIINKTKTPCGCTVVKLSEADKIIPPQGELNLSAKFDSSRRKGAQKKSVMIYSNDPLEPMVRLELTAQVQALYGLTPATQLNLRNLQRNQTAKQTLDLTPAEGGASVELVSIEFPPGVPFEYAVEPLDAGTGPGQRIRFTVEDNAPLGTLASEITLKIRVGGVEKSRTMRVRAEIIGELFVQPKIIDMTKQKPRPGTKLVPVDILSTNLLPFDILSVSAGPLLDVGFEETKKTADRTVHRIVMTIREDAPAGPFAALLKVQTTSLDQPLIRVPIYGFIAEAVAADPPLVRLRQDGTGVGTQRQVRLEASPQDVLEVSNVTCANKAITVEVDEEASEDDKNIKYLEVALTGQLNEGIHDTAIILNTNINGAERMEIPVSIVVAGSKK